MTELAKMLAMRAEALQTKVVFLNNLDEALQYAVDMLQKKAPATLLYDNFKTESASEKTLAAPGLAAPAAEKLALLCRENNIKLVENLREHAPGIDVGLSLARYGIADTGTAILATNYDNEGLATMLSEVNLIAIPVNNIKLTAKDLEAELTELMSRPGAVYFVSGSSRTGDIELVMALGAHGPLEVHFLLLENM